MSTFSSVNLHNESVKRIIHAAGASFGRRGFEGTSLNDIARDAGVSKSLLHYHFDSKEHLFLECQLLLLRSLLDQLRLVTDVSSGTFVQLDVALEQVMEFLESNAEQISCVLTFHNVAEKHPQVMDHVHNFNLEVVDMVVQAIHNTLGEHVGRLVLPPERLARLLVTLFNGLIVDLAFATTEDTRALVRRTFGDLRSLITPAVLKEMS